MDEETRIRLAKVEGVLEVIGALLKAGRSIDPSWEPFVHESWKHVNAVRVGGGAAPPQWVRLVSSSSPRMGTNEHG